MLSVFRHSSYREILKEYIDEMSPKRGAANRLARQIGVHPSLISQVSGGGKDLSAEQALAMTTAMSLTEAERDYFLLLVQAERAGTQALKDYYAQKIKKVLKQSKQIGQRVRKSEDVSEADLNKFYSHWTMAAVWLATSIGAGGTVADITARTRIPRAKVVETLAFLEGARLCQKVGSKYKMTTQSLHLDRGSPLLAVHHANWRLRAIQRFERLSDSELSYTAPVSLSRKDFESLRDQLFQLIRDFTEIAVKSEAEDSACLNLDLFWIYDRDDELR